MQFIRLFGLLLALNLVACSPLQTYLKTNTTVFYKESFQSKGSIIVLPGDINLNNSLEFDVYKQKLQAKLGAEGFSIAPDLASADYAALLLYAVDDGKQSLIYTPIYGQTTRRIHSFADVAYNADGKAVYIRRNYLSPSFGVVGASAEAKTTHRQTVALDIVTADSLNQKESVKLYEGRTISSGDCAVIVEVFDELLEAMFTDFPGKNGRNQSRTTDSDINCE